MLDHLMVVIHVMALLAESTSTGMPSGTSLCDTGRLIGTVDEPVLAVVAAQKTSSESDVSLKKRRFR